MSLAEVASFSSETVSVRNYTGVQDKAVLRFYEVQAFFGSRATLSPAELAEGREKLQLFRQYAFSMNHLLDELSSAITEAAKPE